MSSKVLLIVAILFALAAGLTWVAFLRPTPLLTARGTITKKTYKPAGTYWQYPAGMDRGFRNATPIPTAEAYVFQVAVHESADPVFVSLSPHASEAFQVGQNVRIEYRERGIPFLWKRLYVVEMKPGVGE